MDLKYAGHADPRRLILREVSNGRLTLTDLYDEGSVIPVAVYRTTTVIPAQAGIHLLRAKYDKGSVIPAQAGIHLLRVKYDKGSVIPAQAGIHLLRVKMDPRVRGDDD